MKKYLLGMFAIALAIGFSAFTAKQTNAKATSTDRYWYVYDPGTDELVSLISEEKISRETAKSETTCEDDALQPECARGYDALQGTTPVANPAAGDEDPILQTEQ